MAQLRDRLDMYERKYGMTSADFYTRFRAGELGDAVDFVEWSVFWNMVESRQDSQNTVSANERWSSKIGEIIP